MEEDKCVIIKESEWKELRKQAQNSNHWKREYDRLAEEKNTFWKEKEKNTITVEFQCFLANKTGYLSSEELGHTLIDTMQVSIHGDKLTIQGKMRSIIHQIKDKVWANLNGWLKEYVDKEMNNYRNQESYIQSQNKDLQGLIHNHNKLPWYKRFKKIYY